MQLVRWITLAALAATASAQKHSPWYVIGPFEHRGGAASPSTTHSPESELKAHKARGAGSALNQKHRGKNGVELAWAPLRGQAEQDAAWDVGEIDLRQRTPVPADMPSWDQDAALYLYRRFEAAEALDWTTLWTSDAALVVWLDGAVVLEGDVPNGLSRLQEVVRAHLDAGTHHVLVKLVHSDQAEWRVRTSPWAAPSGESIDAAIERAIDGLMQRQRPDGTWSHEQHRDGLLSGAVAWSLPDLGIEPELPLLQLSLESARTSKFESTEGAAWVALGLLRSTEERDRQLVSECRQYLLDAQATGGGWARSSTNRKPDGAPQMRATFHALLALDALRESGASIEPAVFKRALASLETFQAERGRKLDAPEGCGFRAEPAGDASAGATCLGLSVLRCLARGTGVEPQSELGRELADRERAAVRWLEQRGGWSDPPRRARDWGQVALCAFALTRARALGGPASLNGFDVLERAAQEFVGHQRDDGLFQLGGARYVDEPLGLAVLAALRGPAARERRPRRSPLGYDDFELVASGHLDVRLSLGEWAPKIEREFEDRRLPVKLIEFFGVAANRTRDAVSIARVRGGDLTLDDIRRTTLDVVLPMRGRWQVRARVVLEPQSPDSGANGEGRVLLSGWLTLRAERPTTEEQLAEVRGDGVLPFPTRGITVETSSKFDGWPSERAVDRHLATGWACKDSDREPWIRITLTKPLKALGLRLAHAVPSGDGEQWPRATKIELAINERERWTLDVDAEPTQLLRHEFGRELSVKSIEIRVLDKFRPYASEFVGFSEIDLLAPAK